MALSQGAFYAWGMRWALPDDRRSDGHIVRESVLYFLLITSTIQTKRKPTERFLQRTHTHICSYDRYTASLVAVACGEGIRREGGWRCRGERSMHGA